MRTSVLPKALRRGGARPLKLRWPERPRRRHLSLSKLEMARLQRGEAAYFARVIARRIKAARA